MELVVSPDFRFLSRELLDTTIDPLEGERQKQQIVAAGLSNGSFPALGPHDAPVTLTVFSDFQCLYCARLAAGLKTDILPAAQGKVRLVFRNYPLPMHSWARAAAEAEAAACAQEQGDQHFWSVHDFLFEHQREFDPDNLNRKLNDRIARLPLFDRAAYSACVSRKKVSGKIERDVAFGNDIGVHVTPTLFVNAQQVDGYRPQQILTLIREMSNAAMHPRAPAATGTSTR